MGLIPIFSPCAASILNLFDSQVRDVFVASAFLRNEAVSKMLARLLKDRTAPCRLRVLTRGSFSDILAGASDIASLALLTKAHHSDLAIECRRDPRLHAKIYVVDGCKAIITSANLTPPGLLTNIEFGVFVDSHEVVKNILDYFEPIWKMAERFDEKVLDDLCSGVEEENSDTPSEIDRDFPKRVIRSRRPLKPKRHLARLPKTEVVELNTGWDQLNELGMDIEPARATMASGTLKKTLRRIVRVYDKSKQLDIGSGGTAAISPEEVSLINNVETLKLILASPNWELRDAAAEALGNIFGDKVTQVLFEALQRENTKDVLWSILISLRPRITEHNLDQVLKLLERKLNVHLIYLVYLIVATVNPQLYGAELIRHIPNINDSEYIEEIEPVLRGLSDGEFIELTNNLKDWIDSLQKVGLLFSFAQARGDEFENRIQSVLFPHRQEESATPMTDWVVKSLLQRGSPSDKFFELIPISRKKRLQAELEKRIWTNLKTPPQK
jgi:HKD family nuclease